MRCKYCKHLSDIITCKCKDTRILMNSPVFEDFGCRFFAMDWKKLAGDWFCKLCDKLVGER